MAKASDKKTTDLKATGAKQRLFAGGSAPFYLAIFAVIILVGISAVMVVSASSGEAVLNQTEADLGIEATVASFADGLQNLIYIFIGAAVAFIISRLDYRRFSSWGFVFSIIVMLLLFATLIWGATILGAKRWLIVGPFSIQPSELAKPVLVVFVAYVLSLFDEVRDREGLAGARALAFMSIPALIIGLCMFSVIFQPDLGTTLIISFGLLIIYVMSGFGLRYFTLILPVGLMLFLFRAFAQGNYQAQRIQSLFQGLLGGTYSHQVTQGLYALGSGGLFGAGLALSRQKYYYLPEAQNDFILAIVGEEMGLVGTLLVVGAFALLMWAGFEITQGARDRMGRVLAAGATTILITQALMNLLAVTGLGPVTGKPLPFVTLGGSAMISSFALLGIILSVARFGGEPREGYAQHESWFLSCARWWMNLIERNVSGRRPVRVPRTARLTAEAGEKSIEFDEWDEKTAQRTKEKRTKRDTTRKKSGGRWSRKATSRRGKVLDAPGGDEDEINLEWGWDSRTRLPGSRISS